MKRNVLVIYATLAVVILLIAGTHGAEAKSGPAKPLQAVSGFWYTEGHEGGIELYPCGDQICGRFQWLKNDDAEHGSHDDHNPDPDLRQRSLCHVQFMGGFTPDGSGHYANGWIYNPRDGGTYSAEMTLVDSQTLSLRGYLLLPLLGESQTWTRAKTMPSCAAAGQ